MTSRVVTEILPGGLTFDMILVEGGGFDMGNADAQGNVAQKPVHRVKLSDLYLARFPVTQVLWTAIMGLDPAHFKGDNLPVEQVSWNDAQAFIKKLNSATNKSYRLPTEAEWEYAARGGARMSGDGYLYAGSDKLKEVGWYDENSNGESHEVGLKYPNELELYDMSGNVFEWCGDHWHPNYDGAPADGSAWVIDGQRDGVRTVRGGSWINQSSSCCATYRSLNSPTFHDRDIGFRLALSIELMD